MIKPFEIQVRFADIDVMGHVNNAVYLSYLEMTRVYYLEQLLGEKWDYNTDGFLLARNEVDYIKPILLHQKPKIRLYTDHIGNRSFTFGYEITVNEEVMTKAKSVLVAFNNKEQKPIAIPDKLREALEKLVP
ncbi:MAG: acyl-CoA thioesterase [Crocinitomicaceae bacterium]|jgi:acyl-CoA thioester hydrolase|nr:acyl-CoA thioesterase [Crocinitomicaceae bacterium]